MDFGLGTYVVGFLAGAASILSPCVLPILPILIASALSKHRLGTAALALGLALSFAIVGTFIATLGASIGLGAQTLRQVAAVLMVVFGLVMLSPRLQLAFGRISSRIGSSGQQALGSIKGEGLASQFAIGLLLGLVWSPCVGPTLGAASTLAAQGKNLGQIALLMLLFGLGAGLPLLLLGGLSHATMMRIRGSLSSIGHAAKSAMGGLFVVFGVLILSGFDRKLETMLLSISPDWLTKLTTSL
ncbi:cytochrome c biogenesis CcdA family protein [Rhodanobacter sp. MP1X3]|uniref:cytochrome c biogenesis CcdA family protein n=1 Tax=Rhodanobacter sp. MP1X3 TaxID=2723086 RepID=UPI00161D6E31|nr:cytochrome c biogenesis CcdA family protein [Rhodanobacter sp. MP1X3]